jgi:hypothetical protein
LAWKAGALTDVTIVCARASRLSLRYGMAARQIDVEGGQPLRLDAQLRPLTPRAS